MGRLIFPSTLLAVILTAWIGLDACSHPLLAMALCLAYVMVAAWIGFVVASLILPDARRQASGSGGIRR